MMELEHAQLLLIKAAQDEFVLVHLEGIENTPPEAFGFHAQQAAEKLLKAVLVSAGVDYPLTHRLEDLLNLLEDHGISLPERFSGLDSLTPFAVEFRYDIFPVESEAPFDQTEMLKWIVDLRTWAEAFVHRQLELK